MRYITKELKKRGSKELTKPYKNSYKIRNQGYKILKHFSKIKLIKFLH